MSEVCPISRRQERVPEESAVRVIHCRRKNDARLRLATPLLRKMRCREYYNAARIDYSFAGKTSRRENRARERGSEFIGREKERDGFYLIWDTLRDSLSV